MVWSFTKECLSLSDDDNNASSNNPNPTNPTTSSSSSSSGGGSSGIVEAKAIAKRLTQSSVVHSNIIHYNF